MNLRPATHDDLDSLLRLESQGFDHAAWSRDAWAAELDGAGRHVLVVADPEVVGAATFSRFDDVAELLRVVVAPERRGEGIATSLLGKGIEWAASATRMLLEVEETNVAARKLYDRNGFAVIARRQDYYGTGHHALVMEKEL